MLAWLEFLHRVLSFGVQECSDQGIEQDTGGMELGPGTGLVLVLALMFSGSLLAGAAPYVLTIPAASLGPLSGLGGGLLLGAAMSIVIPEGLHAMMEVRGSGWG